MIRSIEKSACLPLWLSAYLIAAVAFATLGQALLASPANSPRQDAITPTCKVSFAFLKGDGKQGTRKVTLQQRLQAIGANTDARLSPARLRFFSIVTAAGDRLVNAHAGTIRERAPPV